MDVIGVIRERLRIAPTYGMFISEAESTQIDRELDAIIDTVKKSSNLQSAAKEISELNMLSEMLANSCFRYRISLSENQKSIVALFDRGYPDEDPGEFAFQAIQSGQFPDRVRWDVNN